ncbi:MAG: DUF4446 family protein [Angustibacter sp.]
MSTIEFSLDDPAHLISVIACLLAVIALGVAIGAVAQVRQTRQLIRSLRGTHPHGDLLQVAAGQSAEVAALAQRVAEQRQQLARTQVALESSLRRVSVVRFDAFDDSGGQMSFSAALLDANGDGLLLTSINGRGDSRTYGKAVIGGASEVTLLPEETAALAQAR